MNNDQGDNEFTVYNEPFSLNIFAPNDYLNTNLKGYRKRCQGYNKQIATVP